MMLGACTIIEKPLAPPPLETTIVTPLAEEPEISPVKPPQIAVKPPPTPVIKVETLKPLNVAIIISQDIENHHIIYHKLEELITDKKGSVTPFYLYQQSTTDIIEQIKEAQHLQIVAIGLEAAKAASSLSRIPVIFCQIYNYQDHNLVNEYIKGVSLIPSLEQQFQAWKTVFPQLKTVGFITGRGKQPLIDSALKTAATYDITLINHTVNNDKEMWGEFRRLTPQVDAFWLLPDNRILSKRTLRSIVSYSTKHTTPLFTINGLLLQAGAVISSSQVDDDIAQKVVTRLLSINPDQTIPGRDVEALDQALSFINTQTTKRLNLIIPTEKMPENLKRWPLSRVKAILNTIKTTTISGITNRASEYKH